MLKSALLAMLVCVNAVLLGGIVLMTTSTPTALAQAQPADAEKQAVDAIAAAGGALSGNYLLVAGEIQDQYDALYLLDTTSRNLYAFKYDRGRRELELVAARDLEADFRNNRVAP